MARGAIQAIFEGRKTQFISMGRFDTKTHVYFEGSLIRVE